VSLLGLGIGLGFVGGAASEAAWTPASDEDLVAWWDMGAGATVNGSNQLTALADQSGTGDAAKDLAFAGAGSIAYTASDAAYNDMPTATFSGNQRLEGSGAWAVALAQPHTIYIVGESDTDGGRIIDGGASGGRAMIVRSGTLWQIYAMGGAGVNATGSVAANPSMVCGVFNGASSAVYVGSDFSSAAGTGNPGTNSVAQFVLGALGGGGGELNGKIAEVIVSSGAHDATLRANYAAYFAGKFGL
jgi:hypothetical protein